ncbi:MAG: hypothetical protein ACK52I_27265 [Pseudomonadota bacterium]
MSNAEGNDEMMRRFFVFGVLFLPLSLPLAYMIVKSEDQMPWLFASALYFVFGGLIGNWYVFFGGGRASVAKVLGWLVLNGIVALTIAVAYMTITRQL